MSIIADFFPLLISIALLLGRIEPIRLEDYFSTRADWEREIDGLKPQEVPGVYFWLVLATLIPATALFAFLQYQLFRLRAPDLPDPGFAYRATDNIAYSIVVGLFLGICIASIPILHWTRRQGREYVRQFLTRTWNGSYVYLNMRRSRPMVLALGIGFAALNLWVSNIYLAIDDIELSFSTWTMVRSGSRPVDSVECINLYRRRIAPIGTKTNKLTLEIVFRDGSTLDTFYLIERYHYRAVIGAIKDAASNPIPVYERSWPKRRTAQGDCG